MCRKCDSRAKHHNDVEHGLIKSAVSPYLDEIWASHVMSLKSFGWKWGMELELLQWISYGSLWVAIMGFGIEGLL